MNKTNTINERIKEVRQCFTGGSNIKFAKIVGKHPNATSNWVRDGYKVGRGTAALVAEKFNVSMSWLLTGEGEMLRENGQKTPESAFLPEVGYSGSEILLMRIIEGKDAKIEELSRRIGELEAENRLLKERHFRDMAVSDADSAVAG